MADNARMYSASTTANAPATKHANTGHQKDERNAAEAEPPSSNAWNAMTPDAFPEPERVVPMTKEDERHLKEDLHKDPAQLLQKQLDNRSKLEHRQEEYQEAAPGQRLEDMAAAEAIGIDPAADAAATPRPTAEMLDSNRLTEDDKMAPEPFVRRETGT